MKAAWLFPLAALLAAALAGPCSGQVCHDWDTDGALAGWQCAGQTDCLDRSWQHRPGTVDRCDGLDNDCDGTLDHGCDRYCDEGALFGRNKELLFEAHPKGQRPCTVLTDSGFLAASERFLDDSGLDRLVYARGYDRLATAWASSSAVGNPSITNPDERRCEIASAGDRTIISYRDEHTNNQDTYRMMARVVDALGLPLGSGPMDLSATSPVGSGAPWLYHSTVWDGERFVIFWVPEFRQDLLMTVVTLHSDGTPDSPTTTIVTNNVDGNSTTIQGVRAVWTGDHFLVTVTTDAPNLDPNLRVLEVSRDGIVERNTGISTHSDPGIHSALGTDRMVVVFTQRTAISLKFFAAFFDLEGRYLQPPGTVTLYSVGPNITQANKRVSWSGEMFGIVLATYAYENGQYVYTWRFWRLLPDGTNLDPGGRLLAHDTSLDDIYGLHWAGGDFWLFAVRNTSKVVRERIVCSCSDADADGFNACTQLDCDDSDPLTNPLAVEVCRGLKDEDCDGLTDCDDPDCPGGPGPPDVPDLKWTVTTPPKLAWSAVAGAQRYDLSRGLMSDVRRRGDVLEADCPGLELSQPSWPDDGRLPPAGDALWYLVRSEGVPCALGTWGQASVPRQVSACR